MSQGKGRVAQRFHAIGKLEKCLAERLALMAQEVAARGEAGA